MTDKETAVELAKLRAEMHATNTSMERIANSMEKVTGDHEVRIRKLESTNERTLGVLKVVSFIGAPGVAALIVFFATKA